MPRSTWDGSIAFGLVNIPIKLCSATRDHRPKFRLLRARDESPRPAGKSTSRKGHAA